MSCYQYIHTPQGSLVFQWEQETDPFDELIVSWNAFRPTNGFFKISVSLKIGTWSPWLPYAQWGVSQQYSFELTAQNFPIKVWQDTIVIEKAEASAFRVRVEAKEGARFQDLFSLFACTTNLKKFSFIEKENEYEFIKLNVVGLSQFCLSDPRKARLCSPTSTTSVVRYLSGSTQLEPITFADRIRDASFDIFGHWVFNIAQAFVELGGEWNCWIEHLTNFSSLYQKLEKGIPVVVSVKGPLKGAPLPYQEGHLMVVIGYQPDQRRVICMDPAYEDESQTITTYPLQDFLQAWNRRKNIAYIFEAR
jgi:hypothetical protein